MRIPDSRIPPYPAGLPRCARLTTPPTPQSPQNTLTSTPLGSKADRRLVLTERARFVCLIGTTEADYEDVFCNFRGIARDSRLGGTTRLSEIERVVRGG